MKGIECDGGPACKAPVHVHGCFAERPEYGMREWIADNLVGAKDAATLIGVQVPNLKQTGLQPVTRISGGTIPVYLRSDVDVVRSAREERAARRAAVSE